MNTRLSRPPLARIHARADCEYIDEGPSPEDADIHGEKQIFQEFLKRFDLSLRAKQWGRVLRVQPESFEKLQPLIEEVLETFVGHVDAVLDGVAFVTLCSPTREILTGHYPAAELAKYGIVEGSRFECSTMRLGSTNVKIRFAPSIPLAEPERRCNKSKSDLVSSWMMTVSEKIPDKEQVLELHVFGTGQGESILLRLPGDRWGVVDYYASTQSDSASSPALDYLESRAVRELEFVCLTHPHSDHFRGMGQLLDRFPPRHLWLFPLGDANSFHRLAVYFGLSDLDLCEPQDNADELRKILAWCGQRRSRSVECKLKYVTLGKDIYPSPEEPDSAIAIRGIAPPDQIVLSYISDLFSCFRPDGTLARKLSDRDHNSISVALMIRWNNTRILLGGDVEARGWTIALEECPDRLQSCSAVKVSHHGSGTGYCPGLWEAIGDPNRTLAVLTPFYRHNLPDPETVLHIEDHIHNLFLTAPAVRVAPNTRGALKRPTGESPSLACSSHGFPRPHRQSGWPLLVHFDDQGRCISKEIIEPAFRRIALAESARV